MMDMDDYVNKLIAKINDLENLNNNLRKEIVALKEKQNLHIDENKFDEK